MQTTRDLDWYSNCQASERHVFGCRRRFTNVIDFVIWKNATTSSSEMERWSIYSVNKIKSFCLYIIASGTFNEHAFPCVRWFIFYFLSSCLAHLTLSLFSFYFKMGWWQRNATCVYFEPIRMHSHSWYTKFVEYHFGISKNRVFASRFLFFHKPIDVIYKFASFGVKIGQKIMHPKGQNRPNL